MGSGIFYSKIANTQKNVKKSRFSRMLFFAGIMLFTLPFQGKAQTPSFVNGASQPITLCENYNLYDIDSLLSVNDANGNSETWTLGTSPTNGYFAGNVADGGTDMSTVSGGVALSPDGQIMYTPNPGYTGPDTFSIYVSNGTNSDTIVFYVNVLTTPALTLGTSPTVCAGGATTSISYSGLAGLGPIVTNYNYTGNPQSFSVPAGISSITFDAAGGIGGSDNASGAPNPGKGGRIQGTLNVIPGQSLNVYVGQSGYNGSPFGATGGYNGGGNAYNYPGIGCGGAGGGASDIRLTGNALTDRVVVAGGGGGNGYDAPVGAYAGGDGGGLTGGSSTPNVGGSSATGGTQAAGGMHAVRSGWLSGTDGTSGVGGDGSIEGVSGGAGGGYYGGGGGVWNGGGGGSSFADPSLTTLVTNTQGYNIGDGYVNITYNIAGTYMITWDATAHGAGFVDVPSTALPAGSFPITVPAGAAASTYNGTVTISNGICSSDFPFTVTVNPIPNVDPASIPSQSLCNNGLTTAVTPASTAVPVGTNFSWTNDNTSIGLPASGSGAISAFTATNSTAIPQLADITYTDTAAGCAGAPAMFTITVNPTPMLTTTAVGSQCNFILFNYNATSATTGTVFEWSRAAMVGLSNAAAGPTFGNISEVPVDTLNVPIAVPYVYTLTANTCVNTQTVTLTVNPSSLLTSAVNPPAICSGDTFNYLPAASTTATTTTFSWTRNTEPGLTEIAGSGSGNVNEQLKTIYPNGVNVPYIYYLTAYGCTTPNGAMSVNVNAIPTLSSSLTPAAVCPNDSFTYNATSATTGSSFMWNRGVVAGTSSDSGRVGVGNVSDWLVDTTTNPVLVTYQYALYANGCSDTQNVVVDFRPNPVLNSAHTDGVCSGAPYTYMGTSATSGTMFSWTRGVASGISTTPNSGSTGTISETLTNTTDTAAVAVYAFTLADSGCVNMDTLRLIVNPTPAITSSVHDTAVCDSSTLTYVPTSSVKGSSFAWSRVYVSGISNPPATGTGNLNEALDNTTFVNVTATYVYSVTAGSCAGTPVDIHVTVHPTPKLSGDHNFVTCSGVNFNYDAQSYVAGTTFKWTRPYVLGIEPANADDTGNVINDVLVDSVYVPLTTVYHYELTANGCTNIYGDEITVLVNPGPDFGPGIITTASNTPCLNTMFQTFGAATPPPAGEIYKWTATDATVWSESPNEQYAYVSFNIPGLAYVILNGTIEATGCTGLFKLPVNVGTSSSDNVEVLYYQSQFIALESDEDTYQWGYDDNITFASTTVAGATGQNYYDPNADFVHNHYWVVTTHNGCTSKSYYNQPTGVANVNAKDGDMRVYPNPANREVNVEINTTATGEMQVEVLNVLGQKITMVPTVNKQANVNVADLPPGCYLVECYREGVKIATSRFIKN